VKITATVNGQSDFLIFEVLEPDGAYMRPEPGTGLEHTRGVASLGFMAEIFVTPKHVNFGAVQIREGEVEAVATGFLEYENGDLHGLGEWTPMQEHRADLGTLSRGFDTIYGDVKGGPPYKDGTFTWSIPWFFKVGDGEPKQFTTMDHVKTVDSTGRVTIRKGGLTRSRALDDPTSKYKPAGVP
jgi:hypothetical protein